MRASLAFLLCLCLGCAGERPGDADHGGPKDPGTQRDMAGAGDMSQAPDQPAPDQQRTCAGLSECDCRASPDCQPITEPCYCPFPQCGNGACLCGGGAFLGCAPRASACEGQVTCRPAGRVAGPDDKGCYACKYETDCERAFKQMMDKLKATPGCGISDALVSAFNCKNKPDCLTQCVNAVNRCDDIKCGLCAACGCAAIGSFEQCVYACWR